MTYVRLVPLISLTYLYYMFPKRALVTRLVQGSGSNLWTGRHSMSWICFPSHLQELWYTRREPLFDRDICYSVSRQHVIGNPIFLPPPTR
ncbi:hypothetical protein J6590_070990 [Homalodisca vitripennis]|nr:hypothetical protein J6590_070990 [Homalodisca vitripennis]